MIADLDVSSNGDNETITIALANGKKIVGCISNRDEVEIKENTTPLNNETAEIAALMALAIKSEFGENYVVWKRFVSNVEAFKKESAKARLFIN